MTKIVGEGEVSFGFLLKKNREKNRINLKTASIEEIRLWMDRTFPETFPAERKEEIIKKIEETRKRRGRS